MAYTKPFTQTVEQVIFSDSEPSTTNPGVIWIDTNADPVTWKMRDPDGAWQTIAVTMTQAATIAALGATADLTAIPAVFAALADARTAVNTLAGEVEARLDAIEAAHDDLLAHLKAAKLMA